MTNSEIQKHLTELIELPSPGSNIAVDSYGPKLTNTIVRHTYWYDSIIDWMLKNPGRTQKECAKAFNKSEPTMRMLIQSDMFKNRFETRRREMNEEISREITEETSSMALSALREVNKRLRENPAAIPIGQMAELANSALDRLGYGQKPLAQSSTNTTVNLSVAVSPAVLNDARQSMRELQSKNSLAPARVTDLIDVTPKEQS